MTKAFKCSLSINTVPQAQDIPGYIGVLELPKKRHLVRAWVTQCSRQWEIAYLDILRRKSGLQQIWPAEVWTDDDVNAPWAPQQLGQVIIDNERFGIGIWRNRATDEGVQFDLTFVPMQAQSAEVSGQGRRPRSRNRPRWGRLGL